MIEKSPDDPSIVRQYRLLVAAIEQATEMVLYQGCSSLDQPHPEEPVISFDSYQFYKEPLPLKPEDAVKLTELCSNPENFNFDGESWLCAFHEDYCVEWRSGEQAVQLVFCFSCREVYGLQRDASFLMAMASQDVFADLLPITPSTEDDWDESVGVQGDHAELDWTEFYGAEDEVWQDSDSLIARYKELQYLGEDNMSGTDALELLTISMILAGRGFTLTEDQEDWLPPFTPDAE